MTIACNTEPVSYLRLERYLLGELGPAERGRIERHLEECDACRLCFEQLESDRVELPPLAVARRGGALPLPRRRRAWMATVAGTAAAGLAAAAVVMFGIRSFDEPSLPDARIAIKGGELAIELIREHDGSIATDPTVFAPGDRFEVRLTCPPGEAQRWDVVVFQDGEAFFPLDPEAPVLCGNAITLPGAFRLSGSEPADVCVELGVDGPTERERLGQNGRGALRRTSVCTTVAPALAR